MKSQKAILLLAIIIAVLLPVSALAVGNRPYEESQPYAIAHESTDAFNETLERTDLDANNTTHVSDFSQETQRAFHDMREQPVSNGTSSGQYHGPTLGDSGWQFGDIKVCKSGTIICDEFTEQPDFQTTDSVSLGEETWHLTVVEYDDELYVVTEISWGKWDMSGLFDEITVLLFAVYSLIVGGFAYQRGESHPRKALALSGYGLVLIASPYAVMFADLGISPLQLATGGLVAGILLVVVTTLSSPDSR